MSLTYVSKCSLLMLVLGAVSLTGCGGFTLTGPNMGPFNSALGVPIPVSPYFQKKPEDRFHMEERYNRVPILGPLTEGGPVTALDPPSDDEVMRALEEIHPTQGGIPLIHEVQRNDVRIVKEPIADYIDPPRVYPLIGPAQLHHAHYKCTVYYRETTRIGWPLPHTLEDEDSREVIYIDHNHFHRCGGDDGTLPTGTPTE
ncbi:MAG: hypothetical protein SGJ19_28325 [Planctomycetia bacterium]|nr:hypothetical protein [Planctomycetia bacterium]